jgi:hypothetical protein
LGEDPFPPEEVKPVKTSKGALFQRLREWRQRSFPSLMRPVKPPAESKDISDPPADIKDDRGES